MGPERSIAEAYLDRAYGNWREYCTCVKNHRLAGAPDVVVNIDLRKSNIPCARPSKPFEIKKDA